MKKTNNSGYCIPEDEIRKIIRDVLLGLQELHEQEIVHMDIKPSNILQRFGKYKLADLGMARFIFKVTEVDKIPEGDSRYLSQELLTTIGTENVPDLKKADIFSLGITAFELMTLQDLDKNGDQWLALRRNNFQFPVSVQNYYSDELLQSIRCMLRSEFEKRPSAQDLLSDVFASPQER